MQKYDGSDRYQLETLNIAAAGRQSALAKQFNVADRSPDALLPLVQLFDPALASKILTDQLLAQKDPQKMSQWIKAAAQLQNPKIGESLVLLL